MEEEYSQSVETHSNNSFFEKIVSDLEMTLRDWGLENGWGEKVYGKNVYSKIIISKPYCVKITYFKNCRI
jgi:hypothetical protein